MFTRCEINNMAAMLGWRCVVDPIFVPARVVGWMDTSKTIVVVPSLPDEAAVLMPSWRLTQAGVRAVATCALGVRKLEDENLRLQKAVEYQDRWINMGVFYRDLAIELGATQAQMIGEQEGAIAELEAPTAGG